MNEQEAIENIKRLKYLVDLVKSPEEYFKHMQGHTKELSLVLTVFDVANSSRVIEEALEKQAKKIDIVGNKCPVSDMWEEKVKSLEDELETERLYSEYWKERAMKTLKLANSYKTSLIKRIKSEGNNSELVTGVN